MVIKILGGGCRRCDRLEANTHEALRMLDLQATVEQVHDLDTIMAYDVVSLPALLADGKILIYGWIPSPEEIAELLCEEA